MGSVACTSSLDKVKTYCSLAPWNPCVHGRYDESGIDRRTPCQRTAGLGPDEARNDARCGAATQQVGLHSWTQEPTRQVEANQLMVIIFAPFKVVLSGRLDCFDGGAPPWATTETPSRAATSRPAGMPDNEGLRRRRMTSRANTISHCGVGDVCVCVSGMDAHRCHVVCRASGRPGPAVDAPPHKMPKGRSAAASPGPVMSARPTYRLDRG